VDIQALQVRKMAELSVLYARDVAKHLIIGSINPGNDGGHNHGQQMTPAENDDREGGC